MYSIITTEYGETRGTFASLKVRSCSSDERLSGCWVTPVLAEKNPNHSHITQAGQCATHSDELDT